MKNKKVTKNLTKNFLVILLVFLLISAIFSLFAPEENKGSEVSISQLSKEIVRASVRGIGVAVIDSK